jgi:hypothetical protein
VENIKSPTYFLHQLPARTQDILNSQGLLPVHVHRNGPRFVAATVKDAEGQKFFFKQALPGVPADPMMHDKVGDRIIYEAEFLKFLDESGFPHLYTKIVKLSPSEPVWMLRQHLPGFTMTDGDSLYGSNRSSTGWLSRNWLSPISAAFRTLPGHCPRG